MSCAPPPPPPPPTTKTSALVTPFGTAQLQVVVEVKVKMVNPPEEVLDGEQLGKVGVPAVEDVAAPLPIEFTARI